MALTSIALVLAAALSPGEPEAELTLGSAYPLEFVVSYPGALFHWVDSLAGTSGGKTVPAYRAEFVARFGKASRRDVVVLEGFARARAAFVREAGDRGTSRYSRLPGLFLSSVSTEGALARARRESEADLGGIERALRHFEPRYRTIWNDGADVRAFHDRVRSGPARRRLARLLARVAGFLRVDPRTGPRPRVVAAPVPSGFGTHAEAIGRYLLTEIRPGEGLTSQASVIVHENVHFLLDRVPPERLRRFESIAAEFGPDGREAWRVLGEALPTALGQGMADRVFRPDGWSRFATWYHRPEVDAAAKAIYPRVRDAVEDRRPLDERLLREILALTIESRGLTPRSP